MARLIKFLGYFLLIVILYVVGVLVHGTVTDYQPETEITLEPTNGRGLEIIQDSILSFAIWNIGYAGLGEESDFFYDDGSMWWAGNGMVRASEAIVEKNLMGIKKLIPSIQTDFWLFQEVDIESKRSYFTDQMKQIEAIIPSFSTTFAANYVAPRVPLPILEPWRAYGKVKSGLGTFTKYNPTSANRLQLPGDYDWPVRIFQLDRCAAVHRFKLATGKELVLVNVHNSAYDKGGVLKKQQMDFLKELFLQEYNKGHYVIAGGDWNQCPPYFRYDALSKNKKTVTEINNIDPEFLPESWNWIYDARVATNRSVADAYVQGETFVTVIDFFLVSPNIKVLAAKGIDTQFQFSDHQPVWMEVQLLD